MARMARVVVTDHPHHVTQRGVRSMTVFSDAADCLSYLRFLGQEARRFDLEILAWSLMINHVHLVVIPRRLDTLARAIGNAHRRYTWKKNRADGVKGYLFQGRFYSCVLDEPHLLAAARYVDLNPVRAGMVKRPQDYRWSSARFHLGLVGVDPLVQDGTLMGLVSDWRSLLASPDDRMDDELRRSTRTGRPVGDSSFLQLVGKLTGRILQKRRPGPKPRKRRKAN